MSDQSQHPDAASSAKPGADWVKAADYGDIEYHVAEGIAKITINRARGAQRVPAADVVRALRRVRPRA